MVQYHDFLLESFLVGAIKKSIGSIAMFKLKIFYPKPCKYFLPGIFLSIIFGTSFFPI